MKYFKVNKKVIPEKSDFIQEIFFPMLKRLKNGTSSELCFASVSNCIQFMLKITCKWNYNLCL